MNNDITLTGYLKDYTFDEFEKSLKEIHRYYDDKFYYRDSSLKFGRDLIITENYSGKNLRRSHYINCRFIKTNFASSGLTGSTFVECYFIDCIFDNANFHSCEFRQCKFYTESTTGELNRAGFHKSSFSACEFSHLTFLSAGFTDTLLSKCVFCNCEIRSSSVENAVFADTVFINSNFSRLNMEFLEFQNITMKNTILPFTTLPYIYNGLQYLKETNDDVFIRSFSDSNELITSKEYISLLEQLKVFYGYNQEYFALANIHISLGEYQYAANSVLNGIIVAIEMKNYRMLVKYCRIISLSNMFDMKLRNMLYDKIMAYINNNVLDEVEYHLYTMYVSQIKEVLLEYRATMPRAEIQICTNLQIEQVAEISDVMGIVNSVVKNNISDQGNSHFEIRHNSPVNISVIITDFVVNILPTVGTLYATLIGVDKILTLVKKQINDYYDLSIKDIDLKAKKSSLELTRLQIAEKKISVEKQELEFKKCRSTLEENDIKVTRVNHYIRSVNEESGLSPELLSYSVEG